MENHGSSRYKSNEEMRMAQMTGTDNITPEPKEELLAFVGENAGDYEVAWFPKDGPNFNGVTRSAA